MVMDRSKHDELLTELMETSDDARRVEIAMELRNDYTTVTEEHNTFTQDVERLNKENEGIRLANSALWRQLGQDIHQEDEDEVNEEFSETATLEDVERQLNL